MNDAPIINIDNMVIMEVNDLDNTSDNTGSNIDGFTSNESDNSHTSNAKKRIKKKLNKNKRRIKRMKNIERFGIDTCETVVYYSELGMDYLPKVKQDIDLTGKDTENNNGCKYCKVLTINDNDLCIKCKFKHKILDKKKLKI